MPWPLDPSDAAPLIGYDCASAPAPEDARLICMVCEQMLLGEGIRVRRLSDRHSMGKCSFCQRRSPVYPAICAVEKK